MLILTSIYYLKGKFKGKNSFRRRKITKKITKKQKKKNTIKILFSFDKNKSCKDYLLFHAN